MKILILIICLTWNISCSGIKLNQLITNKSLKVEAFFNEKINESDIPGIQYIVMDSTRIIFEYAGGWADIKSQIQMKPTTTMMAFSMTKTITAAAVLQLVEKGKINLNDSIDKYIANNPYGEAVTIRHLLSQTSGIPDPIPLTWVHQAELHKDFDEDAAFAKVLKENPELSFEPGEKYAYSNISYWLLGKVIERASGQSYPGYIRENILKPLQLSKNEMSYTIQDETNHAKGYLAKYSFFNLIKGFLIDDGLIGEYEENWLNINNVYLNGPAFGGLIGSTRSFSNFLQDQLKKNSQLFNNETKNLFFAQQKNNSSEFIEMSLGWHVKDLDETNYFFKEGGGAGFHGEMRIYPAKGIASIIIVNKTNFNSTNYMNLVDKEFLTY